MSKSLYAIGVDLGGTAVKVGIVSESGKIIKKTSLDTNAKNGPDSVLSSIKKGIDQLISKKNKKDFIGIGLGSPGTVSSKKGIVENPPNFPGWESVPIGNILQKHYDLKCSIENDANAAAIGEMIFGAGKKLDSFLMVTLGTGVGGGIIINRKIYRGMFGAAGEFGHVSIDYKGQNCNCGSTGCIEAYAGNNYLVRWVTEELRNYSTSLLNDLIKNNNNQLTPKLIHEAAEQNDTFALYVIDKLGNYLGYALASLINTLDIGKVIVGGGVSGFGDRLFNSIEGTIKERVLTALRPRIKVSPAKLKNAAGIKGASAIAFYKA